MSQGKLTKLPIKAIILHFSFEPFSIFFRFFQFSSKNEEKLTPGTWSATNFTSKMTIWIGFWVVLLLWKTKFTYFFSCSKKSKKSWFSEKSVSFRFQAHKTVKIVEIMYLDSHFRCKISRRIRPSAQNFRKTRGKSGK